MNVDGLTLPNDVWTLLAASITRHAVCACAREWALCCRTTARTMRGACDARSAMIERVRVDERAALCVIADAQEKTQTCEHDYLFDIAGASNLYALSAAAMCRWARAWMRCYPTGAAKRRYELYVDTSDGVRSDVARVYADVGDDDRVACVCFIFETGSAAWLVGEGDYQDYYESEERVPCTDDAPLVVERRLRAWLHERRISRALDVQMYDGADAADAMARCVRHVAREITTERPRSDETLASFATRLDEASIEWLAIVEALHDSARRRTRIGADDGDQ